MFSRSLKIKLLWRSKTGLPAPTYSATHWWSKWEVIKHLHGAFGDIPSFVEEEDLYTAFKDGPLVLSTYKEIATLLGTNTTQTQMQWQPSSHHSHPIDPFSSSNYSIMERCV